MYTVDAHKEEYILSSMTATPGVCMRSAIYEAIPLYSSALFVLNAQKEIL